MRSSIKFSITWCLLCARPQGCHRGQSKAPERRSHPAVTQGNGPRSKIYPQNSFLSLPHLLSWLFLSLSHLEEARQVRSGQRQEGVARERNNEEAEKDQKDTDGRRKRSRERERLSHMEEPAVKVTNAHRRVAQPDRIQSHPPARLCEWLQLPPVLLCMQHYHRSQNSPSLSVFKTSVPHQGVSPRAILQGIPCLCWTRKAKGMCGPRRPGRPLHKGWSLGLTWPFDLWEPRSRTHRLFLC